MRVIVMFDLPTETTRDRIEYVHFRKALIKDGYIMMQQSIYCKLVMSPSAAYLAKERVRRCKPPKGVIQLMIITEKQYAEIEYILGGAHHIQVNHTDRLVII